MTRSPCEKCPNKLTPKNEIPCAACPDPAEYAESLGHPSLPTRTIKEMVKVQPYKPPVKEPESMSNILKKVFKPCPGPLHNGENLPLDKFSKSTATVDGRSKICIECQKKQLDGMPLKEKKKRGCPPGGWPKKESITEKNDRISREMGTTETRNIPDWISGKIDHPSKPLPKITPEKENLMPPHVEVEKDSKFDLSGFTPVSATDIKKVFPSITFRRSAILFNTFICREIQGMKSCTPMVEPEGKRRIAFKFFSDTSGLVKLTHHTETMDINNRSLMKFLNVKPGKYPAEMIGGIAVVEVKRNE